MNAVHLYNAALDAGDATNIAAMLETLSPVERARARRFRFEVDRRRFVVCRGLLRQILSQWVAERPAQIHFAVNSYGKPFLPDWRVAFNVSHSGGRALIAVTSGRELGVDIERINPAFAQEQIPERYFSRAEVRALRSLPQSEQTSAFFRCWTRKEAYIKARGFGLSMPLDSFDVTLQAELPAAILRGGDGWSLQALPAPEGFAAALAVEGPPARLISHDLPTQVLTC
jgi:4'-phosphopantetheinyl transferase